ncbi:MAG: hypothetical protein IPH27_15205 [Actinomycetales bacterium]|nr:hypothetical protein [Candidatus Phosphoribacter baldrii]
MRWLVNLEGNREDVERLLAQPPKGLAATTEAHVALLELVDPHHAYQSEEALAAGRTLLDSALRHLNGLGKLRWGRVFADLTIRSVSFVADDGSTGQVWFGSKAYAHLLPDEFGDMMELLGRGRPKLPDGLQDVTALDLAEAVDLAARLPNVARVLRFVELMLVGDEGIDWAAGYAALEVVEQSAADQQVSGQQLGWWTRLDRERFRQMASSSEAAGMTSRHPGRRYEAPKVPMSASEGAWFVRTAVARWIRWFSQRAACGTDQQPDPTGPPPPPDHAGRSRE